MYFVPRRRRVKLDRRYEQGIYLGTAQNSNEHFVSRPDGAVTRARAVARLPLEQRWDKLAVENIVGTPAVPNPGMNDDDDALLESHYEPHLDADAELRERLSKDDVNIGSTSAWYSRYRIMKADITKYGATGTCPRCTHIMLGDTQTSINHTEDCRSRVYLLFREHKDPGFVKALTCSPEFNRRQKAIAEHHIRGGKKPSTSRSLSKTP